MFGAANVCLLYRTDNESEFQLDRGKLLLLWHGLTIPFDRGLIWTTMGLAWLRKMVKTTFKTDPECLQLFSHCQLFS